MTKTYSFKETTNEGLARAYEVTVAGDAIESRVNDELHKIGKQVKIPGFRPGKIPLNILKQRYQKNAMGDVINQVVDDALRETFKEYDVVPALQPDVKIESFEEGKDMVLSIALDVMPEAPEIDFTKLEITKPVIAIEEEQIQDSLNRLAEGKRETKDRAKTAKAQKGNIVLIDFKGFLGDEAFAGGEGKEFSLELGSGQFIPGFEDQLIGAKAGEEREVTVTFPEAYHSADLAGKEARFEVVVHKVQEVKVPEMTDELAKEFGFEGLDSLKDFVRSNLEKEYVGVVRNYQKKQLFDVLDPQCDFEVPQKMLDMEYDAIWQQAVQNAKSRGESEEDLESQREEYQTIASRRVRLGILLSQTAGRNNIEITQQDLQKAILDQARMYPGQEQKVIEFFHKNPQQAAELKGPIMEDKAVDLILEQAKITEVAKTIEELQKEEEQEEEAKAKKAPKAKKAASSASSATDKKKADAKEGAATKKAASSGKAKETKASSKTAKETKPKATKAKEPAKAKTTSKAATKKRLQKRMMHD